MSPPEVYSSYKVIMPHVIKSPSFSPLCPLSCEVSVLSSGQQQADVTAQKARRPRLLGTRLSPSSCLFILLFFSPLPVIISHSVLSCTLPVTETAALEEQVAAGHRADLTRLLKPDGTRKKKRDTNEAAPKGRKSSSMNSETLTVPSLSCKNTLLI